MIELHISCFQSWNFATCNVHSPSRLHSFYASAFYFLLLRTGGAGDYKLLDVLVRVVDCEVFQHSGVANLLVVEGGVRVMVSFIVSHFPKHLLASNRFRSRKDVMRRQSLAAEPTLTPVAPARPPRPVNASLALHGINTCALPPPLPPRRTQGSNAVANETSFTDTRSHALAPRGTDFLFLFLPLLRSLKYLYSALSSEHDRLEVRKTLSALGYLLNVETDVEVWSIHCMSLLVFIRRILQIRDEADFQYLLMSLLVNVEVALSSHRFPSLILVVQALDSVYLEWFVQRRDDSERAHNSNESLRGRGQAALSFSSGLSGDNQVESSASSRAPRDRPSISTEKDLSIVHVRSPTRPAAAPSLHYESIKQGPLLKQGTWNPLWKQKWFVLTPTSLLKYNSSNIQVSPEAIIPLNGCVVRLGVSGSHLLSSFVASELGRS